MSVERIGNHVWQAVKDVLRQADGACAPGDVVLPMTLVARLDAVLRSTKKAVLDCDASLDRASPNDREEALRRASRRDYYNRSEFTLGELRTDARPERLEADFNAYLDGFSPNIRTILDGFGFRERVRGLSEEGVLGKLIAKFASGEVHLGPDPVRRAEGTIAQPGLEDDTMRSVFSELARRCRPGNGEETADRRTPRDALELMTKLVFLPVAQDIQPGFYSVYDGACGTGETLIAANESLRAFAGAQHRQVSTHLHGQEIDTRSCAIARANLLLDGAAATACTIVGGAERSTLSADGFPAHQFDFVLSHPPHGKGWKADLERMGGKKRMRDPRFAVQHGDDPGLPLLPRTSDSQMLFLVDALSKMRRGTPLGSRIAQLHSGASLFSGDAGRGESNIRRWIIENDWLEAIVALPCNILHDTGNAAFLWVLANRKPAHRRGKVQLIDAASWFSDLPQSLGRKSRRLSEEHVARICDTFLTFRESEHSRILDNEAFGCWKVTVERALRIAGIDPNRVHSAGEIGRLKKTGKRGETAPPVIVKIHEPGTPPRPLHGLFPATIGGAAAVVEYEPDPDLRDAELVPLQEEGGIDGFMSREVLPYAPDAWYRPETVRIGYQINFNRHFYRPRPARPLDEIRAEILALERDTGGLLQNILAETG